MKKRYTNIILLILTAIVLFGPMALTQNSNFKGTDNKAGEMIQKVAPDYKPWMGNIWQPNAVVESYLFTFQAAVGSLVIGYIIGFGRGKKIGKGN